MPIIQLCLMAPTYFILLIFPHIWNLKNVLSQKFMKYMTNRTSNFHLYKDTDLIAKLQETSRCLRIKQSLKENYFLFKFYVLSAVTKYIFEICISLKYVCHLFCPPPK